MFPVRDLDLINVLLSQSQGSGTIGHECRKKLMGSISCLRSSPFLGKCFHMALL